MEIKFYGVFVLNRRVVLHAIDATPARLVDFHTGVGLVERRLDGLVAFGRRVELHGLIAALRRRARCCLVVAESRSVRVHAPPRAEGLVRGEAVSQ